MGGLSPAISGLFLCFEFNMFLVYSRLNYCHHSSVIDCSSCNVVAYLMAEMMNQDIEPDRWEDDEIKSPGESELKELEVGLRKILCLCNRSGELQQIIMKRLGELFTVQLSIDSK